MVRLSCLGAPCFALTLVPVSDRLRLLLYPFGIHVEMFWPALILVASLIEVTASKVLDSGHNSDAHFDYVIVGGGTAGLVVASRLSENPHTNVAVIEAGDFEMNNPNVTNTTALGIAQGTNLDWQYVSVPQAFAGNKSLIWRAGKGLGGSSLINGESSPARCGSC